MAPRRLFAPTACLETNPSARSIRLGGRYISIARVAEEGHFENGYLSRIMSGKRTPTLEYAKRLATVLGLLVNGEPDITALFALIEERKMELDAEYRRRMA